MDSTPRIALQIDTSTGFSSQLIQGVVQYVREHQRWTLLVQSRGARERWRIPAHWKPNGVIARVTQASQARDLAKLEVPVLNVSRSVISGYPFPQVTIEERLIGEWAADHLLERGFTNFGYLGLSTQANYTDRCGPAFCERLAEHGFECATFRPFSAGGRAREEPTIAELRRWLRSLARPLGVLAVGIEDAFALTEACWSTSDLRVPDSVAILCGEDDPLLSSISNPPLSCIDPDARRVGYVAAEQLDALLSGGADIAARRLIPPRQIVVRQSTDTSAFDDADIVEAVRFIRTAAGTPIQVDDVAQHVAISRRSLEQRFTRLVGRTPAAEIRRVRIERVKELLRDTDWPMPRIAAAAGFSSAEVMNHTFRRVLNLTPTAYRRMARS